MSGVPLRKGFWYYAIWLSVGILIGIISHQINNPRLISLVKGPLLQAKIAHPTRLMHEGPSPQLVDDIAIPTGVEQITYTSGNAKMMAWLMLPKTPGRHSAVLFCHGGFALGNGDEEAPRAFVDAGYIVLLPTFRGENGNSGNFEMFFGEVNDAKAAIDYLAGRNDVDTTHLFATGHSAGGTIAMLLAEIDPRLRKAAACGGCPNIRAFTDHFHRPAFEETPYNWTDPIENDLRSPALHIADLTCPLKLFYGEKERPYIQQARSMVKPAHKLGKNVTVEVIPNASHFGALAPAVQQMIPFFNE